MDRWLSEPNGCWAKQGERAVKHIYTIGLALFCALVCAIPSDAQQEDELKITHQKVGDITITTVETSPLALVKGRIDPDSFKISAGVNLTITIVDTVAQGKKQMRRISLEFLVTDASLALEPTLVFIPDDKRMSVYAVRHSLPVRCDCATVHAAITLEELKQLGSAGTVLGRLGTIEFELNPEHQKAIMKIVAYLSKGDK